MLNLEIIERNPEGQIQPHVLLFVHGAWHGAWCWENFQSWFTQRGYVNFALSFRGHGRSPGGSQIHQWRVRDYLDDLSQVVSRLPMPPILIGHSLGGWVIQRYLEKHAVPGAVLLAPVPARTGALGFMARSMLRRPRVAVEQLTLNPRALFETPEQARRTFFSSHTAQSELERHAARLQIDSRLLPLDTTFQRLNTAQIRRNLQGRMLVVAGKQDGVFSMRENKATAQAYQADISTFDAGHDLMLDAGWEAVASTIHQWLQKNNLATTGHGSGSGLSDALAAALSIKGEVPISPELLGGAS